MKDLFKAEQVNVQKALDIVQLILGDNKIRLYYQTAFKLCSDLQGASKIAMQHEGIKPDFWHKLAVYEGQVIDTPVNRTYRRSSYTSSVNDPVVDIRGSLVVIHFDDLVVKLHFSDAAQLCVWVRVAAKHCKNWAGDRSRIRNVYARLTDAEENEKLILA
jgi:hypothetical protein